MAVLDTTHAATGSIGLVGRIGATFASVVNAVIEWNDARVTRNVLNGLTDRELADIGLFRGQIETFSEGRR